MFIFKYSKLLKYNTILLILSFLLIVINCKKTTNLADSVLSGRLTFSKGDVKVNNKKAFLGHRINQNDKVVTGKNAIAIIQIANGILITMKANSDFAISKMAFGPDGKPKVTVDLHKGYLFNKVKKGKANYAVQSGTAIAAVRGTSFSTKVNKKGKLAVKLLTGSVTVAPKINGVVQKDKDILLEQGQKVIVDKKGIRPVKKLSKKETESLKKLNKIQLVKLDQNQTAPVQVNVPEEIQKELAPKEDEPDDSVKKKAKPKYLTLEELKAKYGKVSKIYTKDGKIHTGVFKQKGGYMEIITTKGIVKVKTNNIKKVE